MRTNLKKATAFVLSMNFLAESIIPAWGQEYKTYDYSGKSEDGGVIVGVYEPYHKLLKVFRYFLKVMPYQGKEIVIKGPNVKCVYKGKVSVNVTGIDKVGELKSNRPYSVYVCRQIISPEFLNNKFRTNFDKDRKGEADGLTNYYFTHMPAGGSPDKKGAIELIRDLMSVYAVSSGYLAVENLHFHTHKHKCGLFKKCIDLIWDEDVKWFGISIANSGKNIGNGYYLQEMGIANNLPKDRTRIYKKTKKSWSLGGIMFIQALSIVGLSLLGAPTWLLYGLMGAFGTSDLVSGFSNGFGAGAYTGRGFLPTYFENFSKDFDTISNDGSEALKNRFISGSDVSPNELDGYRLANEIYTAYSGFKSPSIFPLNVLYNNYNTSNLNSNSGNKDISQYIKKALRGERRW